VRNCPWRVEIDLGERKNCPWRVKIVLGMKNVTVERKIVLGE